MLFFCSIGMITMLPLTDDEMFSDAYKITDSKDGMFYEVEGKVSYVCGTQVGSVSV